MRRLFSALLLLAILGLGVAALYQTPHPAPVNQPPLVGQIDRIVIHKTKREMTLLQKGVEVRRFAIALGFAPAGDKTRQGDGRTPEGHFRINRRNGQSRFHLSLGLDYPQADDRARAKAAGYDPGGDIMIHGQPNAMPVGMKAKGDWTAGCIALTNAQMDTLWAVTPVGTEVEITP